VIQKGNSSEEGVALGKGSAKRMQPNGRERIRNAKVNSRGMLRLRAFGGGRVLARIRYVEIIDS
jgi:hypothetical protein